MLFRVVTHIIQEQLIKLKSDLEDIRTLDNAVTTAADRLLVVRESLRKVGIFQPFQL